MYQRQVSFTEAINMAFNKYCCFTGRASLSEFWWFSLFTAILGFAISLVCGILGLGDTATSSILGIVNLALLLPGLGLSIRRLHDIGKGGGWIFINLIPIAGFIIYLSWCCKHSEMQPNRFGDVPNLVAA